MKKKLNAYEFVDKFDLVMSSSSGSLEKTYPKVKDMVVFKRVLGSQYKNFVLKQGVSEKDFARACHIIAKKGLLLSKANISSLLGGE